MLLASEILNQSGHTSMMNAIILQAFLFCQFCVAGFTALNLKIINARLV